jgi:Inner membrane component of T3SS, cytoplasmic domain
MSEFKLCENGHYFPQSLKDCPYCPKSSQFNQGGGGGSLLDKTIITGNDYDKPQFIGGGGQLSTYGGGGGNLGKTQIFSGGNQDFSPFSNQFQTPQPSYGRKLVGWLVSFTIDPNGSDYKLFEGRNLIGSDMACDIVVPNDAAVSARHLTILHRMGHFKFKDELSTNGTFINDVFEEEGNLKDGDMIRIGDTVFKFRSIA